MKKAFLIFLIFLGLYSCQNSVSENSIKFNSDSVSNIQSELAQSKIITTDGFYFAKKYKSGVDEVDPPVYNKGELVYFVLRNVGNFAEDKKGDAHFDMHMKVEGPNGLNVVVKRNMLNKRGVRRLKNNRLNLPNARFQTTESDKPGTYRFYIVLEDKLTSDSITVSGDFFIN